MANEEGAGAKFHPVKFKALDYTVSGFVKPETVNGVKTLTIKGNLELDLGKEKLALGTIEVEVGLDGVMFAGDTATVIIGVT